MTATTPTDEAAIGGSSPPGAPRPTTGLERQSFARGGALNLVGAGVNGLFTFVLVLVLTKRIGQEQVGAFMVSVAGLTIMSQASQLGANTGFVRFIPLLRVRGQASAVRSLLPRVYTIVAAAGIAGGAVMYTLASSLADVLGSEEDARIAVDYLRAMSFFVPFASVFLVASQCSQAFGTMTPAVLVDKIGRSVLQVVAVGVLATAGVTATVVGYGIAFPAGLAILGVWIWRAAASERDDTVQVEPPVKEFWRFSLPRALSTTFQVTVLWADTILIGFLRSPEEAAVYSVATRYLAVGHLIIGALLQAMGPRLATHLANDDHDRARKLYQRSATWVVTAVWPAYLVVAIFAPWLLLIFGAEYTSGTASLRIVAAAMMVAAACGAVDNVLLMAGRSWISVTNWGAALAVNLTLNLWLIPVMGIEGAAIAWAASILVRNVIPVVEVWFLFGIHPFSTGYARVTTAAVAVVGGCSLVAVAVGGATATTFLAGALPGLLVYAGLVLRWRRRLLGAGPGDAATEI